MLQENIQNFLRNVRRKLVILRPEIDISGFSAIAPA